MAVVPQETHLAFEYSVLEVVLMGRYPHLGAFEIEGPRGGDNPRPPRGGPRPPAVEAPRITTRPRRGSAGRGISGPYAISSGATARGW